MEDAAVNRQAKLKIVLEKFMLDVMVCGCWLDCKSNANRYQ
jgi:hypothetical protein